MRAADDDALLGEKNRGETFRATQHGNTRKFRRGKSRILRTNRRAIHHQIRALHRFRRMRRGKTQTHTLQTLSLAARHPIRSTYLVTHA